MSEENNPGGYVPEQRSFSNEESAEGANEVMLLQQQNEQLKQFAQNLVEESKFASEVAGSDRSFFISKFTQIVESFRELKRNPLFSDAILPTDQLLFVGALQSSLESLLEKPNFLDRFARILLENQVRLLVSSVDDEIRLILEDDLGAKSESSTNRRESAVDSQVVETLDGVYENIQKIAGKMNDEFSLIKGVVLVGFETIEADLEKVEQDMIRIVARGDVLEGPTNHKARIEAMRRQLDEYRLRFFNLWRGDLERIAVLHQQTIDAEKSNPILFKDKQARKVRRDLLKNLDNDTNKLFSLLNELKIKNPGFADKVDDTKERVAKVADLLQTINFDFWSICLPYENDHFNQTKAGHLMWFLIRVGNLDIDSETFPVRVGRNLYEKEELAEKLNDLFSSAISSVESELITPQHHELVDFLRQKVEVQLSRLGFSAEETDSGDGATGGGGDGGSGRGESGVEGGERGDDYWAREFRKIFNQFESIDSLIMGRSDVVSGKGVPSVTTDIEEKIQDPILKEQLINELQARANLHDAYMVFMGANYEVEPLESKLGALNMAPKHFETLFHGIKGVRELVPVALSMFEMALKASLPGFESSNYTPANWRSFRTEVEAKIAEMLGEKGEVAAKLAGRLVEATGMPAYYEDKFGFDKAMPQRDVMNTEGRRSYYGRLSRTDKDKGSGLRYHGMTPTVGKYFNLNPGLAEQQAEEKKRVAKKDKKKFLKSECRAFNGDGQYVNPIIGFDKEPGEPDWDLVSDFWMHAQVINPQTQETRRIGDKMTLFVGNGSLTVNYGPIKTLARNNRYKSGEKPNMLEIRRKLIEDGEEASVLTDEQISVINNLPWAETNVVKYAEIGFFDGNRSVVKGHAHREWVEQMIQRLQFHKMITDPMGPGVSELSTGEWILRNQTVTGYLPNSAKGLRDLEAGSPEQADALRRIQALFLNSILEHRSPAIQIDPDLWGSPQDLRDIIRTAQNNGYISKTQASWLMREAGLGGFLCKASRKLAAREARKKAGLPGK